MLNSGFRPPLSRFRQPAPAQSRKLAGMGHGLAPAHMHHPTPNQFYRCLHGDQHQGQQRDTGKVDLARRAIAASRLVREDLGSKVGELFTLGFSSSTRRSVTLPHRLPEQSRKLTQMITTAVHGLHRHSGVAFARACSGAAHSRYGVEPPVDGLTIVIPTPTVVIPAKAGIQ